ncbi:hypothetical protein CANARDRAFT_177480 [[Candida] arabinofermentans NRRL YB-2248]|uniref:threonine--tRNA ligase n=1 Tax=[Candida] arabinofermentans NRRL YB-2248 TaxID=983967 RepID=A0A1E4SW97_9ASCO|nr:hypothetical protein CANARDRAFT_177480 [[Candida] arabinofermentans NRRL YB-2248]
MIDENSPGSIFFLPHGARIFNKLVTFMKLQQKKQGFNEVITPLIFKKKLWETSGHWENYHEDMFKVEGNDITKLDQDELNTTYGLKPMNCPGHCIIYSRFARSHNELPIRLSDWSSLHRNEASGALTGLTRVRRFHQDDGHIFCTKDQVGEEISKTIQLIKLCYNVFGFGNSFKMMLSTRPESHIGTIEEWDQAETQLTNVLNESIGTDGSWFIREGDGAFYGPKIDVLLTDNFGKEHQVATIQLDFQLPQRFELEYQSDTGSLETPIMIHRAIFGSVERFLSLLIDHYDGKWPFWLSPRQAVIIPINSSHVEYSQELRKTLSNELDKDDFNVATKLTGYNFIVDVDDRTETVGFRTKDAIAKGYNYIIMIGDKEVENGQVAIRSRDNRKVELKTAQQVLQQFIDLEDSYK